MINQDLIAKSFQTVWFSVKDISRDAIGHRVDAICQLMESINANDVLQQNLESLLVSVGSMGTSREDIHKH
jgi:hypothetical protein